jgi:hypothetical protein
MHNVTRTVLSRVKVTSWGTIPLRGQPLKVHHMYIHTRPCHSSGGYSLGRWPDFEPESHHMRFVLDKMELGQIFSKYFGFPCQSSFHQLLHNHPQLSSGAGTIGRKWPQYKGLSFTPLRIRRPIATSPVEYRNLCDELVCNVYTHVTHIEYTAENCVMVILLCELH